MKIKYCLFICLLGGVFISSAKNNIKDFEEKFVSLNDTLLVKKTETTNVEYKQFLINQDSISKMKYIPDSTQWMEKFKYSFNEPYVKLYNSHPGFNDYPVVNVTFDAANKYCIWLTDFYNSKPDRKFKKVKFRLPTDIEWRKAASPLMGHVLPWYGSLPYEKPEKNKEPQMLANIKVYDFVSEANKYNFDNIITCGKVGSFPENKIGVYDIIGNVSEMTLEGKLKGGNWDSHIEDCYINKSQEYSLPDPRVGFRIVMIVLEK